MAAEMNTFTSCLLLVFADELKKANISGWGTQEQLNEVGGMLDGS